MGFRDDVFHKNLRACLRYTICFFIGLLAKGWESSKDIGLPMCTIRKTYSRVAKRICTKPNRVRHTSIKSHPPGPQSSITSGDVIISVILCCTKTSFANKHIVFQFSHDISIRFTTLSGVTWDPIVLSRKFRPHS